LFPLASVPGISIPLHRSLPLGCVFVCVFFQSNISVFPIVSNFFRGFGARLPSVPFFFFFCIVLFFVAPCSFLVYVCRQCFSPFASAVQTRASMVLATRHRFYSFSTVIAFHCISKVVFLASCGRRFVCIVLCPIHQSVLMSSPSSYQWWWRSMFQYQGNIFLCCIRLFLPWSCFLWSCLAIPSLSLFRVAHLEPAIFSTIFFSAIAFLENFVFAWPSCLVSVFVYVCSPLQSLSRGGAWNISVQLASSPYFSTSKCVSPCIFLFRSCRRVFFVSIHPLISVQSPLRLVSAQEKGQSIISTIFSSTIFNQFSVHFSLLFRGGLVCFCFCLLPFQYFSIAKRNSMGSISSVLINTFFPHAQNY